MTGRRVLMVVATCWCNCVAAVAVVSRVLVRVLCRGMCSSSRAAGCCDGRALAGVVGGIGGIGGVVGVVIVGGVGGLGIAGAFGGTGILDAVAVAAAAL